MYRCGRINMAGITDLQGILARDLLGVLAREITGDQVEMSAFSPGVIWPYGGHIA